MRITFKIALAISSFIFWQTFPSYGKIEITSNEVEITEYKDHYEIYCTKEVTIKSEKIFGKSDEVQVILLKEKNNP